MWDKKPKEQPSSPAHSRPHTRTRVDTSSGEAKAGKLKWWCTDSPDEPVTGLSLQVTGFAPKPQVAVSANQLEVC